MADRGRLRASGRGDIGAGIASGPAGLVLTSLVLAGCGVGVSGSDDLPAPDRRVPAAYAAADTGATSARPNTASRPASWWAVFHDPVLTGLIGNAFPESPDIMLAASRLREARALARQEGARLFPTFDFGAEAEGRSNVGLSPLAQADNAGLFDAGFDAAWEIDLFGAVRRSGDAADAGARAAAARFDDAMVSLTAEIAAAYIDLRDAQATLAILDESIALQGRTRDLVRQQQAVGVASLLDADRAEAAVMRLEAGRPSLRRDIDGAINRLSVLSGRPPGALSGMLSEMQPIPTPRAMPDPGIPADLLRRRPDLRAAEHDIAEAAARLDVAVADLYPRLTIPGSVSVSASGLGTGTIVQTMLSSLSAALSIPLFDGGRRQAAVDAAEEQARQALYTYRRTLLLALEEVESGLINYRAASDRRDMLDSALATADRGTDRAVARFEGGLADFLEVLDAQRERAEIARDRVEAEAAAARAVVRISKAIGGGTVGVFAPDALETDALETAPQTDAEEIGTADNAVVQPKGPGPVMQAAGDRPG